MSLALYVVAAINRDSGRSAEAGLKYFILGALSSGMLLYGASLVYGFTGTVSFSGIAKAANPGSIGLIVGLVFLFAGFCFKVSAVPFHMWTRTSTRAPRPHYRVLRRRPQDRWHRHVRAHHHRGLPGHRAGMAADRGVRLHCLDGARAFAAIGQRNIKRLMAYSSIGHMGFALIGLAPATSDGSKACWSTWRSIWP